MKTYHALLLSTLALTGQAYAATSTVQNQLAEFTVIAPLDPVSGAYTDSGFSAGTLSDGKKIGEFTATKTTQTNPSPIAVRWSTVSGTASEEWKHELVGSKPTNKLKVLLADAKSLGENRWLDHNIPNVTATSTTFDVKVDGTQTVVADSYAVSLDAASYAP